MKLPAWKIADLIAITGVAPDVEIEPDEQEALEATVKPVKERAVRKVAAEKAVAQ